MAEMIVVKCDIGSKAVAVLCPNCARISRQILKEAFNNDSNNELLTAHTCPVCGTVYHVCNSFGADAWRAAFLRYTMSSDFYNNAVKENYNRKKQAVLDAQRIAEQKPEALHVPVSEIKTITPGEISSQNQLTAGDLSEEKTKERVPVAEENPVEVIEKTFLMNLEKDTSEEVTESSDIAAQTPVIDPFWMLMERKIDRWKKKLLDTGKRNKMINYRESKRQTLKILEPGATELFNLLAVNEKTLTFQRPISKNSDFRTYSMLCGQFFDGRTDRAFS